MTILFEPKHYNPHATLGLHTTDQTQTIRLWRPGADKIYLEVLGEIVGAEKVHESWVFEYTPKTKLSPKDYRIFHQNGQLAHDPYAFLPTIGEMDTFLFNKGCHYNLYSVLGANVRQIQGVEGTQFAVWAPNAASVSVVGDFNNWDGRIFPMRSMGTSGIWEIFMPEIKTGQKYKYEIHTREGYLRLKSDPVAFYSELRPQTASIVFDVNQYQWNDSAWMQERPKKTLNCPMNIYEIHLGSWRHYGEEFPNYREIAIDLAKYCNDMGFTHVELLPIMEHPLDESWAYQVTGFFAVPSRYGTPTDFQFVVDHFHQQN